MLNLNCLQICYLSIKYIIWLLDTSLAIRKGEDLTFKSIYFTLEFLSCNIMCFYITQLIKLPACYNIFYHGSQLKRKSLPFDTHEYMYIKLLQLDSIHRECSTCFTAVDSTEYFLSRVSLVLSYITKNSVIYALEIRIQKNQIYNLKSQFIHARKKFF